MATTHKVQSFHEVDLPGLELCSLPAACADNFTAIKWSLSVYRTIPQHVSQLGESRVTIVRVFGSHSFVNACFPTARAGGCCQET